MTGLRCPWPTKPLDIAYHDTEWGVPVHDDRVRFEFLTLEGAQAGLSWSTVLSRRENYRSAFAEWDVHAIARFTAPDIERLVFINTYLDHRTAARQALDARERDGIVLAFDTAAAVSAVECRLVHEHANRGGAGRQQLRRVSVDTLLKQLREHVGCQLLSRAGVVENAVGEVGIPTRPEAGAAVFGRGRSIEHVANACRRLLIHVPHESRHAAG